MSARRSITGARGRRLATTPLLGALLSLVPARAEAQATTFYLDRLQIAGAPDDGLGVWRPQIGQTRLYGQLALGYASNPLRADNLVDDPDAAEALRGAPVADQLTTYLTAGGEILERASIQVTLPITVFQSGSPTDNPGAGVLEAVNLAAFAPADLRIDGRVVLFENEARSFKLGFRGAFFLPIGDERSFTGDIDTWSNLGLSAGLTTRWLVLTLNAGVSLRPRNRLNQLTVGSELTHGLAAYVPLLDGRLRLGAEVFGSLGLLPETAGDIDAAPLEGSLNGRLFLNDRHTTWLGLGAGTRLDNGYAPDFRTVALFGGALDVARLDTGAGVPASTLPEDTDSGKDKVPDLLDPCPGEPDDPKAPIDGCPEPPAPPAPPAPPDTDKDGFLDAADACPNEPEDKDGIDDADGCPEDDADGDGFPDTADQCPKEPGAHGDDPTKEGCPQFIRRLSTEVQLIKQIDFAFGVSTILQKSYPILDEVTRLLRANPEIKSVRIEGHTDNVGKPETNNILSAIRAAAVRNDLIKRGGIDPSRLTSEGFGSTRPLESNDTARGRTRNRRVEIHIVRQVNVVR